MVKNCRKVHWDHHIQIKWNHKYNYNLASWLAPHVRATRKLKFYPTPNKLQTISFRDKQIVVFAPLLLLLLLLSRMQLGTNVCMQETKLKHFKNYYYYAKCHTFDVLWFILVSSFVSPLCFVVVVDVHVNNSVAMNITSVE